MHICFWWESQRERDHYEDQDISGWMIFRDLEIGWGGVDWIGLAQDRDKWRALVNAIMNLWVPYNAGKLSMATQLKYCSVPYSLLVS
jgi:hypothetical protein